MPDPSQLASLLSQGSDLQAFPLKLIPSLIEGGVGIDQLIKGKRLNKSLVRPDMSIPDSAIQSLNLAKNLATSFYMPGQSAAEQTLNQQFANLSNNAINSASSSSEALGALVAANASRMNAQTDLAGRAEQSYLNRQKNYQNALDNMAEWQQDVWTNNVWNKYVENANKAASLIQSGWSNVINASKDVAGTLSVGGSKKGMSNKDSNKGYIGYNLSDDYKTGNMSDNILNTDIDNLGKIGM
jgi:hypothetical protein